MQAHQLPFSSGEYARRLAKVRTAMDAQAIDLLFVEDPSNMAWLTGYDGWSFYVHQGVIVTHDSLPIWWGRTQDANGAVRTVYVDDSNVIGYPDNFVQSVDRHPMQHLADVVSDLGFGNKRIGVELENYYFSAKAYLVLNEELPNAEFVDATALVNWQRAIKSDEEIAFMYKAAEISEIVVKTALERAEPGLRKNELVAEIVAAGVRGSGNIWGDYPAIVPLVPSGSDAAAPHLTWNGDALKSGEATFFELAGCYRRYHVPLCRTVFLGKPESRILDAAKALAAGLAAGIDAARAGNRACDIANALAGELASSGIDRTGRCGYPIGLSYPPDWGERTISLRPNDETELKAGMTFHFMPGLWMDDWGLEITESILITESGPAETFCNVQRELVVKE